MLMVISLVAPFVAVSVETTRVGSFPADAVITALIESVAISATAKRIANTFFIILTSKKILGIIGLAPLYTHRL